MISPPPPAPYIRRQTSVAKGAMMTPAAAGLATSNDRKTASIQTHIDQAIEELLATLPDPGQLSAAERRGIIARYTAVLEVHFIYWMTGGDISASVDVAASNV